MKLWLDDMRPSPDGYIWCQSVEQAIRTVCLAERPPVDSLSIPLQDPEPIDVIDCDYAAGDYCKQGGNYVEFLIWLAMTGRTHYKIHLHSKRPIDNNMMRFILQTYGFTEI